MKNIVKNLTVVLLAICIAVTGIMSCPEMVAAAYKKSVSKKLTVYPNAEYNDARAALSVNMKQAGTILVTAETVDKKSGSFAISHGGSMCQCGGDPIDGYKKCKGKKKITIKLMLPKGKHLIRFECISKADRKQKLKVTFKAKNKKAVLKVTKVKKISEGPAGDITWK